MLEKDRLRIPHHHGGISLLANHRKFTPKIEDFKKLVEELCKTPIYDKGFISG